ATKTRNKAMLRMVLCFAGGCGAFGLATVAQTQPAPQKPPPAPAQQPSTQPAPSVNPVPASPSQPPAPKPAAAEPSAPVGGAGFEAARSLAEKGDALAQFKVGMMFAAGQEVPQDLAKAAEW